MQRVGRGPGSKRGKTCCRGSKGDKARQGYKRHFGREGGQLPLYRKMPKRGFNHGRFEKETLSLNLGLIDQLFEDGETVIASPHKVYGPETNDLVLQLRKRRIDNVILAGMSANLCVESHLRELLEQGFEVTVVKDATAAAKTPELGDGYAAAVTNYGFIANAVVTTAEAVDAMQS